MPERLPKPPAAATPEHRRLKQNVGAGERKQKTAADEFTQHND
jgi:hypothetical protein